jgi:hypothetical protein
MSWYKKPILLYLDKSWLPLREKSVKWDINYNFSEKTTMAIAADAVLNEDIIGKV